ncbi:MAG: hypothetical protein GF334_10940 [Candidatus Altiarchaeales archaeon]|nr:hypothetical protein [Candidatus Altiarchaeales archaeon]
MHNEYTPKELETLGEALDKTYGTHAAEIHGYKSCKDYLLHMVKTKDSALNRLEQRVCLKYVFNKILQGKKGLDLTEDAIEILYDVPLEELPLLMSEKFRIFEICVEWRLKIGR